VPLVVVLHGYGAAGLGQSVYFGMTTLADREGFLLAYPDGTVDAAGRRFWRASRACCDFAGTNVDDIAYLNAVLDDVQARYRVDAGRVYLVGHSNGGFMAHRMACAASSRIAAIVSLAGATGVDDDYPCAPTSPVGVLQVHGTQDATVRFNGGILTAGEAARYPGAQATVDRWRSLQQCGPFAEVAPTLDLDSAVAGPETTVTRAASCARGGVELWTLTGSAHIPALTPEFARQAWAFLQRHARNP
jgi:polyhydroxybutyrate depolymerase